MEDCILRLCADLLFKQEEFDCKMMEKWTPEEWSFAYHFAASHGLLPIIASLFNRINISDPESKCIILAWFADVEALKGKYLLRLEIMKWLASLLQEKGFDIMFLKGATLAQFYSQPEWRCFSDVDYYLYEKSEVGICLLEKWGFKTHYYAHHHTQTSYKGVLLENHYDFFDCTNHRCNITLNVEMKKLAEIEGKKYHFCFDDNTITNAYCMTPTMNAIFLMRHMSAHFVAETIPFRMIFDWALFLVKQSHEIDWNKVIVLYKESGMMTFAEYIQYIIERKLHVSVEGCLITPRYSCDVDKIWASIINIPKINPYPENCIMYDLFEAKTFFRNHWKHKIVYPKESYVKLFLSLFWINIKRKMNLQDTMK